MPVTNYYSVEGRMLGSASGGGRIDYLTDALGSVTATVSQSSAVVNTYRYKPYGTQLSKTGAGSDPKFTWVGSHGYRETGRPSSDKYVRARHYGTRQGAWTTTDPLWPLESSYSYVRQDPTSLADPSGRYTKKRGLYGLSLSFVVESEIADTVHVASGLGWPKKLFRMTGPEAVSYCDDCFKEPCNCDTIAVNGSLYDNTHINIGTKEKPKWVPAPTSGKPLGPTGDCQGHTSSGTNPNESKISTKIAFQRSEYITARNLFAAGECQKSRIPSSGSSVQRTMLVKLVSGQWQLFTVDAATGQQLCDGFASVARRETSVFILDGGGSTAIWERRANSSEVKRLMGGTRNNNNWIVVYGEAKGRF